MAKLSFLGGVNELGGTKILLEDKGVRIFLDFGINFDRMSRYFSFPYQPRKFNALDVFIALDIYPDFKGIYRADYLEQIGRAKEEKSIDALILSHAHLDHALGTHFFRPDIDVWMDRHTKRILYALQKTSGATYNEFIDFVYVNAIAPRVREAGYMRLTGKAVTMPRSIKLFKPNKSFEIGHLVIEPYYIDHSLPGACAFIIHTSAGSVVYTGDLRLRGRRREDTENFVKAAAKCKPSYLLCEGSLIDKKHVGTEDGVVKHTLDFIKDYNGLIIVSYPPRDLDRLTSFHRIAKKSKRNLVIDTRQAFLLDLFDGDFNYPKTTHKYIKIFLPRKVAGVLDSDVPREFWEKDYYKWERKYLTHKNRVTLEELKQNPGKYILSLSFASLDDLVELKAPKDSVYIRSYPEPYTEEMELDEKRWINWLKRFNLLKEGKQHSLFDHTQLYNIPQAHITGHMSFEKTAWLINEIQPGVLVPIHTFYPESFRKMYDGNIKIVGPNETVVL